jgi:hypothetical protein
VRKSSLKLQMTIQNSLTTLIEN